MQCPLIQLNSQAITNKQACAHIEHTQLLNTLKMYKNVYINTPATPKAFELVSTDIQFQFQTSELATFQEL